MWKYLMFKDRFFPFVFCLVIVSLNEASVKEQKLDNDGGVIIVYQAAADVLIENNMIADTDVNFEIVSNDL